MRSTSFSRVIISISAFAFVLAAALTVRAGDPPAAAAAADVPPANAPAVSRSNPETTLSLQAALYNSGGSLFRAQNAMRVVADSQTPPGAASADNHLDAPAGTAAAASFFAVSPQKPKAYRKHDLISVVARELSAFTSNGSTTETKTQNLDDKLNSFIAVRPSLLQLHSIISGGSNVPEINIANSRDYKGTGSVDHTDTFTDRFTAEVVDVRPNGTMVLQAIKQIRTDEELQRMILTGVCRVEDVSADNSVLTTQLFDLELQTTHKGAVTDSTRRGFLPRLLDTFSPF